MNNIYKSINNIQTHLITYGNPVDCCGKDVIICVTGNPGIPDFYIEFAAELHRNSNLPVCVIGHAGHEEVPDDKSNVLDGQQHLFNLEGQLEHKRDLINNYIDKSSKLHLIGHSIGAWLILELLDRYDIADRVLSINLLFPTIQKMADTRNGKYINNIVRKIHTLAMAFFALVHILPQPVLNIFISMYLKLLSLPNHYISRIKKYLNPKVMEKVLFLAYDEMDKVTSLNTKAIDKVKHLTNVIYSVSDNWVPVELMHDLNKFKPQITLKEVSVNHAFVLKSSERVAEMVIDFIQRKA